MSKSNKSKSESKNKSKKKSESKTETKKSESKTNTDFDSTHYEFQVIDWNYCHEIDDESEHAYIIQLFGRTMSDKDVCVRVTGYCPYFYIEIPPDWDEDDAETLVQALAKKIQYRFKNNPNYEYDYDLSKSLVEYKIVKRERYYGFTNGKKFKFLMLGFKSLIAMRMYSGILSRAVNVGGREISFQRYECNIEPHIRFMHINGLPSCGWIEIDKKNARSVPDYSKCDISISVNWKNVIKSRGNQERIAPFKIMGYDIECISCDENFCQAERPPDKIIQIGITLYRYGSMKCYEQHLITLGDCDSIQSANLECYRTEKGLLMGFAKKIAELRPDFKCGYNICGFDDKYIYDRNNLVDKETAARKKTTVENLMATFMGEFLDVAGKLNNKTIRAEYHGSHVDFEAIGPTNSLTFFRRKQLQSSALGENILEWFQIPGIITIDVFKVIQREHKLQGYKLDNVSANFITETAVKVGINETAPRKKSGIVSINIFTKSTKALEIDSYVQIMVNDGYSSSPLVEGSKYKVRNIVEMRDGTEIYQSIQTEMSESEFAELNIVMQNKGLKVFWTFAKDDMHHTLINKYFNEGNTEKIALVGKYCLKDCKLVNLLIAKLEILVNTISMAQVCRVPFSYILFRGQAVKIFSLVSEECRGQNILMPLVRVEKDIEDDSVGYEGATVISPKPGVYFAPIPVLDFSSLYPKCMCEKNLSHEMYVSDPAYDNLPDFIYHDTFIDVKDKKGRTKRNPDGTVVREHHRFAQHKSGSYGILPTVLNKLLGTRKEINNRLDADEKKPKDQRMDPFLRNILSALQLAYKITANSLYGQTGAPTSPIYFLPIAASTAATGRQRLYFAKKTVEDNFPGAEIVYGDSVVGDTPLIVRDSDGMIDITTIEVLGSVWKSYAAFKAGESNRRHKQQAKTDLEVWTSNGWSKINRVIRHKTTKTIHRVLTHTGCIDVTEDHSLLTAKNKIIKPGKCVIGTELLHGFMRPNNLLDNISKSKAYDLGTRNKIVPKEILNSVIEIKQAFLNGFLSTNGNCIRSESKELVQSFFYLLKCLGHNVSIDIQSNTFNLEWDNDFQFNSIAIKQNDTIRTTSFDSYVYDLETVDGTFHAGIGELVVKNTDSIFINFHIKGPDGKDLTDKAALLEAIKLGQAAADKINSIVPKPHAILYEKTLWPWISVARKKYVGHKYTDNPDKYVLMSMGIVLKRRDNAPIVKIVVGGIIDTILKTRDIEKALTYVKEVIRKVMDGKYPMDKFLISKTLKSRYKKPQQIAHKVLADRMAARDPGNKPQCNDRISYVYVVRKLSKLGRKNALQGDLIETPEFVIKNGLKIDYLYYLEHQIINPATQILELMVPTKTVNKMFRSFITEEWNKRMGRQQMDKWITYKDSGSESNSDSDSGADDSWEPELE